MLASTHTIKKDQTEKTVRIEMDLVMTADEEDLKKEIEAVLAKYAI